MSRRAHDEIAVDHRYSIVLDMPTVTFVFDQMASGCVIALQEIEVELGRVVLPVRWVSRLVRSDIRDLIADDLFRAFGRQAHWKRRGWQS